MKNIVKKTAKTIRDVLVSIKTGISIGREFIYKKKPRCILITNGMGFGGAPLVLMEAANTYKQHGFDVVIFTEYYGRLITLCRKNGIRVWVAPNGNSWLKRMVLKVKFSFALVNTVVSYEWINMLSQEGVPILWWLHEGNSYIKPIKDVIPKRIPALVKVFTVSERTRKSLDENGLKYDSQMLYYGLNDLAVGENMKYTKTTVGEKYCILIMGAICKRKNQLFALEAYKKLDLQLQKKITLLFVGEPLDKCDSYYLEFLKRIKKENSVKYIQKVDRNNIPKLYGEIDALVCCSIDDPLPVVVTECLMFYKTVIISSATGQYPLIKDGENGFSFIAEDVDDLCEKIISAYASRNNTKLAQNARNVYENYFTKEIFKNNLLNYTNTLEERG